MSRFFIIILFLQSDFLIGQSIVEHSNQVGFELLKRSYNPAKNMIISPLLIAQNMNMVADGAIGDTRQEFEDVFHFEKNDCFDYQNAFGSKSTLASSIWLQQNFNVGVDYHNHLNSCYNSSDYKINFLNPEAYKLINKWVETNTNGHLKELFKTPLPSSTNVVLASAVHFKGVWSSPFDPADSKNESFVIREGNEIETKFMHKEISVDRYDDKLASISILPFKGEDKILFILPRFNFEETLDYLSNDYFDLVLSKLELSSTNVSMPSFDFEFNRDLSQDLKEFGIRKAFTSEASFDNISPNIFIESVKTSARITLNEEGVEASAAVGTVMFKSMPGNFRLNRPFIFIIYNSSNKAIQFIGVVNNPLLN